MCLILFGFPTSGSWVRIHARVVPCTDMSASHPGLDLVVSQERQLLDTQWRASAERLMELLHPDFGEHGTSGRVWSLQDVLTDLPADPTFDGEAVDFDATLLPPNVVLLTYRTITAERTSLRSSVWARCEDGSWRMRFHQGTRARYHPRGSGRT
jgi:hypothetical protein